MLGAVFNMLGKIMNKFFLIGITTIFISGCANTYLQKVAQTSIDRERRDLTVKPKIEFIGWDSNGKLKINSSIQSDLKVLGKVILNEDAIVCESSDILTTKAHNINKYTTGTVFMEELDSELKTISEKRFESFHSLTANTSFDYSMSTGNKLDQIKNNLDKINNSIKNAEERSKYDKDTKNLDDSYAHAKHIMNTCTINKTPISVEVIERKPISKLAKIKWNNAEVWTYEPHLTFRNP
jgi:hypothetical protein